MGFSYAAQIIAGPSTEWCNNELRFLHRTEAEAYAAHLVMKWDTVRIVRVIPTLDPPNFRWDFQLQEAVPLTEGV